MRAYEDLIKRFAKLPLLARFHIAEALETQLQPGNSPEMCARRLADTFLGDLDRYRRFGELVAEAEQDNS